jgi:DNA-binding transcriptional LysR family regulator
MLAEELHFGAAAARLNIAQPALSQQIKRLEKELGVELFERSSRRVFLTVEGRMLLAWARRTLNDADSMARLAKRAASGEAGVLRLGAVSPASLEILPLALQRFVEVSPEVEIQLQILDTPQQVDALLAEQLDIGFLRPWVHNDEIRTVELYQERMLAALSSTHPLAHRNSIKVRELAGESFVSYRHQRSGGYNQMVMGICRDAGFYPDIQQDVDDLYTICAMVAAGLGVALLPKPARNFRVPGVTYLDLVDPQAHAPLCLGWPKGRLVPLARRFARHAKLVADEL